MRDQSRRLGHRIPAHSSQSILVAYVLQQRIFVRGVRLRLILKAHACVISRDLIQRSFNLSHKAGHSFVNVLRRNQDLERSLKHHILRLAEFESGHKSLTPETTVLLHTIASVTYSSTFGQTLVESVSHLARNPRYVQQCKARSNSAWSLAGAWVMTASFTGRHS